VLLPKELRGLPPSRRPRGETPISAFLLEHPNLTIYQIAKACHLDMRSAYALAQDRVPPNFYVAFKLQEVWGIPAAGWLATNLGQTMMAALGRDPKKDKEARRAAWNRWAERNPDKLKKYRRKWNRKRREGGTKNG
jgi:hypothetical protein